MRSKPPRTRPLRLQLESFEDRALLAAEVVFAEPVVYSAGDTPSQVVAEDVDGDGVIDLLVGSWRTSQVSVLLGNGDGTFARQRRFSGGSPNFGTADLDDDGDVDLIAASAQDRTVSVLLNEGSTGDRWEGFSRPTSRIQTSGRPQAVTSGDFDEDGYIDIATGTPVVVFLNEGVTGEQWNGLAEWDTYSPGNHSSYVTSGDVDKNGDLDLVVGNYFGGDVSVLLGNGDGSFDHLDNFPVGNRTGQVILGDLDNDGDLDIASPVFDSSEVAVLIGNGDGTFADAMHYPVSHRTWSMTAADWDADGDLDLAISSFSRSIDLLINNGDGTFFEQEGSIPDAVGHESGLALADVDGDGDMDLLTAGGLSGNVVNVFLNFTGKVRDAIWDGSAELGNVGDGATWDDPNNWTIGGVHDLAPASDFPGDKLTFASAVPDAIVELGQDRIVNSVTFEDDVTLVGSTLSITSGRLTVESEVTATVNSNIGGTKDVLKKGDGTLVVGGSMGEAVVQAGTIRGEGTIAKLTVEPGATLAPGVDVGTIRIDRDVRIEGTLLIELSGAKNDVLDVGNNVFLLEGSTLQLHAISSLGAPGETVRTIVTGRRGGNFTNEPTIGEHLGSGVFAAEVANTGSSVVYTNRSVVVSLFQAAAGDADGDRQFDQRDIVQVLQAGRYLTGIQAGWNEGDWNNDRVVDQLDIVAALQAGTYLNGPYAVSAAR